MPYQPMPGPSRKGQKGVFLRPTPRRRKRKFKWFLVTVALTLLFFAWLSESLTPAVSWEWAMNTLLHVPERSRERCTEMAFLGAMVTTFVAIVKHITDPDEEEQK